MKQGWEVKDLGDVIEIRNGRNQKQVLSKDGDYPIMGSAGNVMGYATDYICEAGTTIIGRKGNINKPIFINERFWNVDTAFGFYPKDEKETDKKFVYYLCLGIDFGKMNRGTTIPSLVKSELQKIPVQFTSIKEQRRIVSILDETFANISKAKENAQQNLKNAKELFESYLEDIFTSKDIDWIDTKLEDVLSVQPRNGWSPPASNHSSKGTPVLTLSSVTGFNFRPEKIKFTSAKTEKHRHYWVSNGDFLITRSNTPELVGHVTIADGIFEPTIYPDLIMRMNPDTSKMIAKFLYYQMRTHSMRLEITGRAQGANPTMKKITKDAVQTLQISYPSLTQQKIIVKKLDQLLNETKKLEAIYQQKINDLEELKKSILQRAFNGEL